MRAKICYSYSILVLKVNIESCKVSMEKKVTSVHEPKLIWDKVDLQVAKPF